MRSPFAELKANPLTPQALRIIFVATGLLYLPWTPVFNYLFPEIYEPLLPRCLEALFFFSAAFFTREGTKAEKWIEPIFLCCVIEATLHNFFMMRINYQVPFYMVGSLLLIGCACPCLSQRRDLAIYSLITACATPGALATRQNPEKWLFFLAVFTMLFFANMLLHLKMKTLLQWEKRTLELAEQEHVYMAASKMNDLGDFAAGIGHDLGQSATLLSILLKRLRCDCSGASCGAPKNVQYVTMCSKAADHVVEVLKALRIFSRSKMNDPFEKVKLVELVDSVKSMALTRRAATFVPLTIDVEAEVGLELECNQSLIMQVLLNLIKNSQDAIDGQPNCWIHMRVQSTNDYHVTFSIMDSGPGIPEAIAEKVMQPFFTTKSIEEGTGLGLYLAKRYVEKHHGTLVLNPGPNTCFLIRLPIVQSTQNL